MRLVLGAVLLLGITGMVSQAMLVREMLIVFSGNELYLLRAGEVVALDGATGKALRTYGRAGRCAKPGSRGW